MPDRKKAVFSPRWRKKGRNNLASGSRILSTSSQVSSTSIGAFTSFSVEWRVINKTLPPFMKVFEKFGNLGIFSDGKFAESLRILALIRGYRRHIDF